MRGWMRFVLALALAFLLGSLISHTKIAHAEDHMRPIVPKSYGKLVTAIPDSIGTGLVFEGEDGTIRFVSVNGMKEGELARYDTTPVHGGIPRLYGHLVAAVVNHGTTGLVFEDAEGTIRFVTVAGKTEQELKRE